MVDGTKINIYNKETKLKYEIINLLGTYDNNGVNNNIYKNPNDNSKSEIQLFYENINKNLFDKNKILVLDRLYFSDKLITECHNNNLNFICRLKINNKYLNKYYLLKELNKKNKKINFYDYLITLKNNNKIRIITFEKNNKTYHLATNLINNKKHDINYFKDAYKKRWNVEIYFKIIKQNTNLNNIKTKDINKLNKEIISINIISFLYNYILNIYKKINKTNKPINNSQFINSFYDELLEKIIYSKIND